MAILVQLDSLKHSAQETAHLLSRYLDQDVNLVKKSVLEKIGAVMNQVQLTTLASLERLKNVDESPVVPLSLSFKADTALQAVLDSGILQNILSVYSEQLVEAVKEKIKGSSSSV